MKSNEPSRSVLWRCEEIMNDVNRTLYIPLYGKAQVSKRGILLNDPMAEKIWDSEKFPIHGKSASKWLTYNMAMRARVFDDWTDQMLSRDNNAIVLHVGCGLDSRCLRVTQTYKVWVDCDFPEVLQARKKYFAETMNYRMIPLDASKPEQIDSLPVGNAAIVILEGVSMYLTKEQLYSFFAALRAKYADLCVLMDVYTKFGARVSKIKNPVHDVGVTELHGIDAIGDFAAGLGLRLTEEHRMTPDELIAELKPCERVLFKLIFNQYLYRKMYRLFEFA